MKSEGEFDALQCSDPDFWSIGSDYLMDTNLIINGPFYCRQGVKKLFLFIEEKVIKKSVRGWILGPPGTGKAISSFAFALKLPRSEWIISWLSVGDVNSSPSFVRFCEKDKLVGQFPGPLWLADLEDTLNVDDLEGKKHILFVDGIKCFYQQSLLIRACMTWAKKGPNTNRLVFITSMSARFKAKHEEDVRNNVEEHRVYSWTLKEYLSAVSNETFFNSVKDILDSTIHVQEFNSTVIEKEKIASRNDLVTSKHYFAGGSCRFMFQYSTEVVIKELHECMRSAKDLHAYVDSNMSIYSSDVVNHLFGYYEQHEYSSVISDFAIRLIACTLDPSLVNRMINFFKAKHNPALHGALLELWFFSSIEANGLELYDRKEGSSETWPKCDCMEFNPNTVSGLPSYPIWLKPLRWNEGGYDAVYVDTNKNHTRFVQATRADEHPFKIWYFSNLLTKFSSIFETKTLEICFVVPIDKVSTFKISPVTGQGLLAAFGDKWSWGKEAESARILGTKKFCTNYQ